MEDEKKKATRRRGHVEDGETVEGQPVENGEQTPGFVADEDAPSKERPADAVPDRGDVPEEGQG